MFMGMVLLVVRNHQQHLHRVPTTLNLSQPGGVFCIPQSRGRLRQTRRCTVPITGAGAASEAEAPGKRHVRKEPASNKMTSRSFNL